MKCKMHKKENTVLPVGASEEVFEFSNLEVRRIQILSHGKSTKNASSCSAKPVKLDNVN